MLGMCVKSRGSEVIMLSEENTVALNMPIFGPTVATVQEQLLEKDKNLKKGKPIYLVLNSPGGSIQDGLNMIEVAKGLGRPVHTISLFSASMSFVTSQKLNDRLVTDATIMMSHRASVGGIGGNIPGSFLTFANFLAKYLSDINKGIAQRSGMTLEAYEKLVADELWMNADEAIRLKFADRKVNLKCDKSLSGYGPVQELSLGFFSVKLQFHKCPMITAPKFAGGDQYIANLLANDKIEFINRYKHLLQ
jgi:ATP-dependent protease ClpP protease subunit